MSRDLHTHNKQLAIRTDRENVATITINRPSVHNAIDRATHDRIQNHLDDISIDPSIDVIIFTGAGERSFVSGTDIDEIAHRTAMDGLDGYLQRLYSHIEDFPKPTIAAVNGYAFGGGFELALACDIRVASKNALFALPETGLGLIPSAGATYRLGRIIGEGRATDMILTGRRVSAGDALSAGLISELADGSNLNQVAHALAQKMRSNGALALRLAKQISRRTITTDHANSMLLERLGQAILYESSEHKEKVEEFFAKNDDHHRAGRG